MVVHPGAPDVRTVNVRDVSQLLWKVKFKGLNKVWGLGLTGRTAHVSECLSLPTVAAH